jgi:signal transduction histidine kinase
MSEQRVLVLASGPEAGLGHSVLEQVGVECSECVSLSAVAEELDKRSAAAVLLTDEIAAMPDLARFAQTIREQPTWSDLPIVLLASGGADSPVAIRMSSLLGNVSILDRPVHVGALGNALRTAIRARQRQYSLRDQNDRRKDEFLATLAHELRNPLAPIRNALEIIRINGSGRSVVEDVAHKMIERQVSQLIRLVDDLLDVSRITTGRLELRRERIDLTQVIRSAVETSRPLIDAAHHELSIELPSNPILLDADPVRLAQVFSNVLNNAARYMGEGGRIRVTAERDDRMVTVIVQDFGIGIAQDMLPRVFDMFAQGEAPGEQSRGGLGIGLTLVKWLVEIHSGSVEAHSEGRGRGTSISIQLPIAAAASAPLQPTKSNTGRRLSSTTHRILIADDNRDAAESMGMLLRLMGNDVRTVFDGLEAVEEAETFRPDVILLDIGMPKLNGYEAARRIRERGWSQGTKLVALTGWGRDDDKHKAAEAGFDRHFTKPIDPAVLERLIADFRSS